MNPDGAEHMDVVDLPMEIAIFLCFIVFGVCLWFIRRERDRRKASGDQNATSPKTSES